MKTTAVIAEQVVSGVLLASWLLLLGFEQWQSRALAVAESLTVGAAIPITLLVTAGLYILGTISDRAADVTIGSAFGWLPRTSLFRSARFGGLSQDDRHRLVVYCSEGSLSAFVDYLRVVIRITRNAALNIACLAVVLVLRESPNTASLSAGCVALGSLFAWATISAEYNESLRFAADLVRRKSES